LSVLLRDRFLGRRTQTTKEEEIGKKNQKKEDSSLFVGVFDVWGSPALTVSAMSTQQIQIPTLTYEK